jgi:3-hydroxybutyryl-CoA dehydrogenase
MMQIKSIIVFGSGTMGSGIAQWFCQQNVKVQLVDINLEFVNSAIDRIQKSWKILQEKGKFSAEEISSFNKLLTSAQVENINTDCQLVIEAIIEKLEAKKDLFEKLDQKLSRDVIFASNTSSFPMATLCQNLSEERKKNFLGLHFFNPATIMKLVEVIKGPWTSPSHIAELSEWFNQHGKVAANCKDVPGFIVNRVARNYYGESFRILNDINSEKVSEIDTVLKNVAGFRMGPFELMDLIGIDVNYAVTQSVWNAFYNDSRFAPHAIQREMVESGKLGKKSGEGFYTYE